MKRREAFVILNVESGASEATIKAAYRAKQLAAHPDKGGSAEDFFRVQAAGKLLLPEQIKRGRGRPQKRKRGPQAASLSERTAARGASKKKYADRVATDAVGRESRAADEKIQLDRQEKHRRDRGWVEQRDDSVPPPPKDVPPSADLAPSTPVRRGTRQTHAALSASTWDTREHVPLGANGSPSLPRAEPRLRPDWTVHQWAKYSDECLAARRPVPSARSGVYFHNHPKRRYWPLATCILKYPKNHVCPCEDCREERKREKKRGKVRRREQRFFDALELQGATEAGMQDIAGESYADVFGEEMPLSLNGVDGGVSHVVSTASLPEPSRSGLRLLGVRDVQHTVVEWAAWADKCIAAGRPIPSPQDFDRQRQMPAASFKN